MEFASQICTTREQSERLLSLGLKKETADLVYRTFGYIEDEKGNKERIYEKPQIYDNWNKENDIPAWSLHRLWEIAAISEVGLDAVSGIAKLYDLVIDNIECQIVRGSIDKEYLEDK